MNPVLASRHAPSFALIQAHFVAGLLGACLFGAGLAWASPALEGHFFQGHLLGLVHLAVLGWLLPIAVGAMHQLVPVVFEVPVRSERLAWIAFALYLVGAAGLIAGIWTCSTGPAFAAAAALLAAAIGLYAVNLLLTLARTKTRSLTGAFVVAALLWLIFAASLGLALAIHLHAPWLATNHLQLLRVHAHAAGVGFFALLIMGVAFRLLEMFLLAYGAPERAGWAAFGCTNAGLALFTLGSWRMAEGIAAAGALAIGVGIACFLAQVRAIHARRTKRRGDTAWHLTFASFAHLAVVGALGIVLVVLDEGEPLRGRLILAYGVLAIPGFVGSVVVGQLYKILPFLVWLHRFAPHVGLKKVPSAAEILPEAPRRAQGALMQAGLAILAAGVVLPSAPVRAAGALLFAASALLAGRNFAVILRSQP